MSLTRPIKSCVVVGGGIAGTAITRLLTERGVDVTLLEKSGQLTSGATWHAAGLVTRFAGSSKIKKIHSRSLDLLTDLHNTTENGIGLHLPGSIRLIEKNHEGRLYEAKQHVDMAQLFDDSEHTTRMIDVDEIQEKHPLVNTDNIECGVFTPSDGDIDPTSLTNCVANIARQAGAKILFNQHVQNIQKHNNSFQITTKEGETHEADSVVNAAGLWSRGVSEMMDPSMCHPAFVIEHQYAITDTMPEIQALEHRLPVLRDLAGSSYIRQEGQGMLIGPYEDVCVVRQDWKHGPPTSWGMELFPDDVDRIADNIMQGIDLVPALGNVGFKSVVNGPTIWTGDGLPRVGRTKIPGYFDFNSLTYGIAQSLALSEYLVHVMLDGEQPADFDASDSFDPLRYSKWASDEYANEKITETYTHNNKVVYGQYENRSAGKITLSPHQYPLHHTLQDHGGVFGGVGASGIEVPMYYNSNKEHDTDPDVSASNVQTHHDFEWSGIVAKEGNHVVEHCGLSYASFSKIRVKGAKARELLESMTTAILPKKPSIDYPCKLTYGVTQKGRMCTEMTICRNAEHDWYLVGNRDRAEMDVVWLKERAVALFGEDNNNDKAIAIEDASEKTCVLHICGPNSPALLSSIEARANKDLKFMTSRVVSEFGNVPGLEVQIFRVSFSGLQGYELHCSSDKSTELFHLIHNSDAANANNMILFGSVALNGLRIEQGFKIGADMNLAHYKEGAIEPFVAKKRQFIGRDDAFVPEKRCVLLRIDTGKGWEWSVLGDSPICQKSDGQVVGFISSSAYGIQTQSTMAIGYFYTNTTFIQTQGKDNDEEALVVQGFGFEWDCTVLDQPPVEMLGRVE